jgi:hypothetical protein
MSCIVQFNSVFRIRIGFNVVRDPPAFYLNAGPDRDPGSQTSVDSDPDPAQILPSQKVGFRHEIFLCGYCGSYKSHFEKLEIRFICQFLSVFLLLHPDSQSQFGSGSGSRRVKSMRIRISYPDQKHWFN